MSAKQCASCHEAKPVQEYSRDTSSGDGLQRRCKWCNKIYLAAWYWDNRDRDREKRRTWRKRWLGRNPAKVKVYRDTHAAGVARWAANNRERRRLAVRKWAANNPEKRRASMRRGEMARRAREMNAFVECVDPRVVYTRDKGVCGICHEHIVGTFHVDHIKPLAKGGKHCYANVQVAHPRCNLSKGAKYGCAA